MLETIAGNTKEVIDKMNDIVWIMNPKYDEGENLREKLEQHVLRVQETVACTIQLKIDAGVDAVKFPMEIRKTILLLCKEALNNALKYAEATVIDIYLDRENNHVCFIVSDNGKGFNPEAVTSNGNGLGIMALRAKNCKGSFTVQSRIGEGTQIKAVIPIPHSR
jgi:signal transduction histidine kinase